MGCYPPPAVDETHAWITDFITDTAHHASPHYTVEGVIYDFRQVTKFESAASSQLANIDSYSLQTMAMALLVANGMQEQLVKMMMKASTGVFHKRIVHSLEDALAFVHEFNVSQRYLSPVS